MSRPPAQNPQDIPFEVILNHVQGLSYWQRRVFLWKQDTSRASRFLYKFRSLSPCDQTSVDRIRDVLLRSRLWLSSPLDFNDPFDMSAKFIVDATVSEKRNRLRDLLKAQGLKSKQIEKVLPGLVIKPEAELAEVAQTAWHKKVASTGIYSFGGDPRSILMWSHYASNHEGLCLQFERATDPKTFLQAIPVDYNDQYPEVNWITDFREGLIPAMLRKHAGWRYERESRIVYIDQAHVYLPFHPEALKGIIIGCRTGENTIATLHELIAERSSFGFPPPTLYRAVQHESKYKLVIKKFEPDR